MSDNFQDLNNINYLKDNPEEKTSLWYKLLKYLSEEPAHIVTNEDGGEEDSLFNFIQEKTDLPETQDNIPGFYDSIYSSLVSTINDQYKSQLIGFNNMTLTDVWFDSYWNNSISDLIFNYGLAYDKIFVESYLSNSLFENQDGTLNKELSHYDKIFTINAGNCFVKESEMYQDYDFCSGYTLTFSYYIDNNGNKISFEPLTYVLSKKQVLNKIPNHYYDLFSGANGGPKYPNWIRMLNGNGDDGRGWNGGDIISAMNASEVYKLELIGNWNSWSDFEDFINSNELRGIPIYGKGTIETLRVKKVINPWIVPWYNNLGDTYKTVRKEDIRKSIMKLGSNTDFGKYFLNFTKENESDFSRLLIPQNKRRVEIEDLNRNFWVIGQALSGISQDILSTNGNFSKVLGGLLNETMQLWENILFLWNQVAIQSQSRHEVHSEAVYITFNDLRDQLNYDWDFDESQIRNLEITQDTVDNRRISRLIRSQNLEEIIVRFLRQYRLKYADYNVSLYPILRLHNYEKENYTRCVLLGEYKYCHDYENMTIDVVNPEDETDIQPPQGHEVSIDGSNVFFTTFSNTNQELCKLPGQKDYHHCQFKESFFSYSKIMDFTGEDDNYYIIDFDAFNCFEFVYGIVEKLDEENYSGCYPLSKSNQMQTENGERAYSLISFEPEKLETSLLPNSDQGLWTTDLSIKGRDVAKLLLLQSNRTDNTLLYFFAYKSINEEHIGISDPRTIHHDDIDFIQIEPANNEFGFFKGELLTTNNITEKAQFNFINLGQKLLSSSNFLKLNEKNYSYYYGRDDAPDIIKQDVIRDQYALTNYLRNAYDNWEQIGDKTNFWNSRTNKIKLPDGQWTENMSERVGYNADQNAVYKKRNEVNQAIDNSTLVWPNFDEDWKLQAINRLNINNSSMSPLTILFVEGKRLINFQPKRGDGQQGEEIIAIDGLVHYTWPNNNSNNTSVNAAIRIPTKNMGASYATYPKHTDATTANRNLWDHYRKRDNNSVNRDGSVIVSSPDISINSYQPINIENKNIDFRKQTLRKLQNDTYTSLITEYNRLSYSGGGDIYLVMRKQGEIEFTNDNWLVNRIHYNYAKNAQYFIPQNKDGDSEIKYNKHYSSTSGLTISGKVASNIGQEMEIWPLEDILYYEQTYQRYIYKNWHDVAQQLDLSIDEFLYNNEITIQKVMYDNNNENEYYLDLNKTMFGWLRIEDGGTVYEAKFSVDKPFIYTNLTSNNLEIIESIRDRNRNGSISKNTETNLNNLKTFIGLIDSSFWTNNNVPNNTVIESISSQNCYGQISIHFEKYTAGNESHEVAQNVWLEDRIMLAQFESEFFMDQEVLYNNNQWPPQNLIDSMSMHTELWYDDNSSIQIQKIEKLIRPLEGILSSPKILTHPDPNNAATYTINDKFYINSYLIDTIKNYVFGPNNVDGKNYARRSIYRYSDYSDQGEDEIKSIIDENYNKWAARPVDPIDSTTIDSLWYDDYDITGMTVDEMRNGYEVYSIIGDEDFEKIEKYKTHRSQKEDTIAGDLGLKTAINDDSDFNTIPNGWTYLN